MCDMTENYITKSGDGIATLSRGQQRLVNVDTYDVGLVLSNNLFDLLTFSHQEAFDVTN